MKVQFESFGCLSIRGERFTADVVIDGGRIRLRRKGPSRSLRDRYGHTPLSIGEEIPWGGALLIVGTGATGSLPVLPEVYDEAESRGIKLVAVPTPDACRLIRGLKRKDVHAILHATC